MKRGQTAQHLVGAFLLGYAALQHLSSAGHHEIILPGLEIAASVGLVAAAIRERVRLTGELKHDRVGWIEIAGAGMGFVEAIHRLFEPHHLSFRIASFLPPTILLLFGVFDVRLQSARYLKADDDFLIARLRLIVPGKRVRWAEMRSFRATPRGVEFTLTNGTARPIKLRDVKNGDAALAWLRAQLTRRGVPELAAP